MNEYETKIGRFYVTGEVDRHGAWSDVTICLRDVVNDAGELYADEIPNLPSESACIDALDDEASNGEDPEQVRLAKFYRCAK